MLFQPLFSIVEILKNMFALKSKNIISGNKTLNGFVVIKQGKIENVFEGEWTGGEIPVTDVGESFIIPGVIDPHVHINEPGRTDWEGFDTATRAAAAGGVTTVVDMPLNSTPVTTSVQHFEAKLNAAKNHVHVNVGFWGGVVPGNELQLDELLKSGVMGLKAFMTHSGIDDFPDSGEKELRNALHVLKQHNKPLLVHCELDMVHSGVQLLKDNPDSYAAYLKSRPNSWEDNAVKRMMDLCRETEARVHVVHLSSIGTLPLIEKIRKDELPFTVETAQHYLFFNAEKIPDGGTEYKCAPPIRTKANNEALWVALQEGLIDFVASDHSPAPPEMKELATGNFNLAWGGIAGLQFALSALWTKAAERKIPMHDVVKWLCANPAKFLKLDGVKGKIANGYDADLVVFNPDEKFVVKEKDILHRHKATPYLGRELKGVIKQTYVGGEKIFDSGSFIHLNRGNLILQP